MCGASTGPPLIGDGESRFPRARRAGAPASTGPPLIGDGETHVPAEAAEIFYWLQRVRR